jgi:hypothetical protein
VCSIQCMVLRSGASWILGVRQRQRQRRARLLAARAGAGEWVQTSEDKRVGGRGGGQVGRDGQRTSNGG